MKKVTILLRLFSIIILLVLFTRPARADTYYVSPSGSDSLGNGSLLNPWLTITHALNSITGTPTNPHTIFVEEGTYSPSATGEIFPLVMESFVSLQGVGDSLTVLDAEAEQAPFERKRVIICHDIRYMRIDGFTIKNGYQDTDSTWVIPGKGGGIYICNSSFITISNNRIENNFAANMGGGVALDSSTYILVTNNSFKENTVDMLYCFGNGGGIGSSLSIGIISYNTISDNGAGAFGGGIYSDYKIKILNNDIIENSAGLFGGGMYVKDFVLILRNEIVSNVASPCGFGASGGGIVFSAYDGIIGGSMFNGNNIYNNYVSDFYPQGHQMLQINGIAPIDARYSYFGNHDPHDSLQVSGNFIIDPYLTSAVEFDTSNLIVVPSPVDFDTVLVNDTKTLKLRFFNVNNSLFDSLEVFDIIHGDTSFSISKTAFIIPPINEDSLTATFNSATEGSFSDTLRIIYTGGELKVALRGVAVDTSTAIPDDIPNLPFCFALHQNYPNPFNAVTHISFDLPLQSRITLKIYNIIGQEVSTPVKDRIFLAGSHEIEFDASRLSTGIYVYQIRSGDFVSSKK